MTFHVINAIGGAIMTPKMYIKDVQFPVFKTMKTTSCEVLHTHRHTGSVSSSSGAMWFVVSLPVALQLKSFGNWEMQRGWCVRMKLIKNAGEHQQPLFSKPALSRSLLVCVISSACSNSHYKLTTVGIVCSVWRRSEEEESFFFL